MVAIVAALSAVGVKGWLAQREQTTRLQVELAKKKAARQDEPGSGA